MFGSSDNPFFDRSFFLTGATRGLGPDLADALAARGAKLVAVDDCQPALDRLAEGIGLATTLACDLSDPLAALGISRWIAAEHRDYGGMICNNTSSRGSGASLHTQIFAPLSIIGLLDRLLPARRPSAVALVLPARPLGRDVARLAGTMRELSWNTSGSLRLTTALLEGGTEGLTERDRRSAAGAVLDALASDRQVLRLRPGRTGWRDRAAPALLWSRPQPG